MGQQKLIPKFELSLSNFNAVLCKMIIFMGYWWNIKTYLLLYFEKGYKSGPNSEFSDIWKTYLTHKIVREDNCPIYSWSSKLLFPAYNCVHHILVSVIYCVKQNTVSTLAFNIPVYIHLFIFPSSTCCSCIMLCSCIALYPVFTFRLNIYAVFFLWKITVGVWQKICNIVKPV
jgi:hypothetical protein